MTSFTKPEVHNVLVLPSGEFDKTFVKFARWQHQSDVRQRCLVKCISQGSFSFQHTFTILIATKSMGIIEHQKYSGGTKLTTIQASPIIGTQLCFGIWYLSLQSCNYLKLAISNLAHNLVFGKQILGTSNLKNNY